jgi:hypothetical protein
MAQSPDYSLVGLAASHQPSGGQQEGRENGGLLKAEG